MFPARKAASTPLLLVVLAAPLVAVQPTTAQQAPTLAALPDGAEAEGPLAGPVPENAYISRDGLDWAWAAPVPAALAGFDIERGAPEGWRLPTAAELTRAPAPVDFVFAGANVPLGGADGGSGARFLVPGPGLEGAAACAAPWFGAWRHCDWVDGQGTFGLPWAGREGQSRYSEQLMVRDSQLPVIPLASDGTRVPCGRGAQPGLSPTLRSG